MLEDLYVCNRSGYLLLQAPTLEDKNLSPSVSMHIDRCSVSMHIDRCSVGMHIDKCSVSMHIDRCS